jgi:hypothetical protein
VPFPIYIARDELSAKTSSRSRAKKKRKSSLWGLHKIPQGLAKKNSIYQLHPPGVEPEPIAWKAIILPLDQECFDEVSNGLINLLIHSWGSHPWKRQFPGFRGAWWMCRAMDLQRCNVAVESSSWCNGGSCKGGISSSPPSPSPSPQKRFEINGNAQIIH